MKKKTKRVRDRISRISYLHADGKWREPRRKFETYQRVDGKRLPGCFETIEEAEAFRDAKGERAIAIGAMKVREAVEIWKRIYFPHIQPSSQENILKVFPSEEERKTKKAAGKDRELPCDFFLDLAIDSITPITIDEWLAHVKRPDYLATLKSTRTSFFHEYEVLNLLFNYYASRMNRNYRPPFLKDHRKKLKFRDAKPRAEKDLPMEKLRAFLSALEEYSLGSVYEFVLPKMAEFEYGTYSRVSEAAAVHLEDVHPATDRIVMSRSVQYLKRGEQRAVLRQGQKANGGRIIHSPEMVKLLLEVAMKRQIRSGPLFFVGGKPIPYKAIQIAYDWAHRQAGTGQTGTHVLRHGSLTEFHGISKDLKQTMKAAGHSDVKSTIRYAKARDNAVSEVQEQMDEKLRAMRAVR